DAGPDDLHVEHVEHRPCGRAERRIVLTVTGASGEDHADDPADLPEDPQGLGPVRAELAEQRLAVVGHHVLRLAAEAGDERVAQDEQILDGIARVGNRLDDRGELLVGDHAQQLALVVGVPEQCPGPDLREVGDLLCGDGGEPAGVEELARGGADPPELVRLVLFAATRLARTAHENHSVGGPAASRRVNTTATTMTVTSTATTGERNAKARTRSGNEDGSSPPGASRHGPSRRPRRSTDRSNGTVAYGTIAETSPRRPVPAVHRLSVHTATVAAQ